MNFQWLQLAALTLMHLGVDMMGGMIPAILPVIRQNYGLSLSAAFTMLAVLNLSANGVQLATGHLRASSRQPFFLVIGLCLTAALCVFGLLPRGAYTFPLLLLLMAIGGSGIAMAHPEGLRAVHSLDRLPPSITTVLFMMGGNLGFAGGGWLSAILAGRWGLSGLLLLLFIQPLCLIAMRLLRIKLSVEDKQPEDEMPADEEHRPSGIPFTRLMLLSIPVATATALLTGYLPTHLHELGFPIAFGGFSALVFGASGVAGSIIWGILARYRGEHGAVRACLLTGIPFLCSYLFTLQHKWALLLLAGAGFCLMAAFPLIVSIARYAEGYNIGRRMAFIVGGSWGIASIVMMLTGIAADVTGVRLILLLSLVIYIAAAGLLVFMLPVKAPRTVRTAIR
ncbi:MAG: MFS transporter [bacterium]|nr:MFS transporter [bacterium]